MNLVKFAVFPLEIAEISSFVLVHRIAVCVEELDQGPELAVNFSNDLHFFLDGFIFEEIRIRQNLLEIRQSKAKLLQVHVGLHSERD
jgi:hypothetical protein